jgi:hypothetical protein
MKNLIVATLLAVSITPLVANTKVVTVKNEVSTMSRHHADKRHSINVEVEFRFEGANSLSKENFIHGRVVIKNIPFGKRAQFNARDAIRRGLTNLEQYFTQQPKVMIEKIKVHVHGHARGVELKRPVDANFVVRAKQGYHIFNTFMILPAGSEMAKPRMKQGAPQEKTVTYKKKTTVEYNN